MVNHIFSCRNYLFIWQQEWVVILHHVSGIQKIRKSFILKMFKVLYKVLKMSFWERAWEWAKMNTLSESLIFTCIHPSTNSSSLSSPSPLTSRTLKVLVARSSAVSWSKWHLIFSCEGAALEVLMYVRLSVCPLPDKPEILKVPSFQKVPEYSRILECFRRFQKVPEGYSSLHAVTIACMQLQ